MNGGYNLKKKTKNEKSHGWEIILFIKLKPNLEHLWKKKLKLINRANCITSLDLSDTYILLTDRRELILFISFNYQIINKTNFQFFNSLNKTEYVWKKCTDVIIHRLKSLGVILFSSFLSATDVFMYYNTYI